MVSNHFNWYCINCGENIQFCCSTNAENQIIPPIETEIKCNMCGRPCKVIVVNNKVFKVQAEVYNPATLEGEDDCIH